MFSLLHLILVKKFDVYRRKLGTEQIRNARMVLQTLIKFSGEACVLTPGKIILPGMKNFNWQNLSSALP